MTNNLGVLRKLNAARTDFHNLSLKKTGHNKFAGYYYFELGDFLIPALNVFNKNDLSSVISFTATEAVMTITDLDDGSSVKITSPMSSAALKGAHEIQNLGAVQTYLRRYLWVAALDIVEHDAVDSAEPVKTPSKATGARAVTVEAWDNLDAESQQFLQNIANEVIGYLANDLVGEAVKYLEDQKLDADEKTAIWSRFDSRQRAAIKKFQQEQK